MSTSMTEEPPREEKPKTTCYPPKGFPHFSFLVVELHKNLKNAKDSGDSPGYFLEEFFSAWRCSPTYSTNPNMKGFNGLMGLLEDRHNLAQKYEESPIPETFLDQFFQVFVQAVASKNYETKAPDITLPGPNATNDSGLFNLVLMLQEAYQEAQKHGAIMDEGHDPASDEDGKSIDENWLFSGRTLSYYFDVVGLLKEDKNVPLLALVRMLEFDHEGTKGQYLWTCQGVVPVYETTMDLFLHVALGFLSPPSSSAVSANILGSTTAFSGILAAVLLFQAVQEDEYVGPVTGQYLADFFSVINVLGTSKADHPQFETLYQLAKMLEDTMTENLDEEAISQTSFDGFFFVARSLAGFPQKTGSADLKDAFKALAADSDGTPLSTSELAPPTVDASTDEGISVDPFQGNHSPAREAQKTPRAVSPVTPE